MSTVISRLYNWATDKTNSVKITASRVDAEMDQVITALNRKVLCAASAPANPINGQTWVDTANNLVKCYLNNAWVIIANYIYIQSATPEGMAEGYLWYDTTNNILKAYNGSTWDTIDMAFPASTAAGDILYLSAAKTLARLAKGTTAQYLKGGDTPSWTDFPPGLGSWVDKSADYGAQQASTDGFVIARSGADHIIYIKTDSANPPTVIRGSGISSSSVPLSVMSPVKKGEYWLVTSDVGNPTAVYWIPLGS